MAEGALGGHAALLREMKGLAPLDQEARNSKSTCLLPQGTEMVDVLWQGLGPDGRPAVPALRGGFASLPRGGEKLPESSEGAGEEELPVTQGHGTPQLLLTILPPPTPAPRA